MAKIAVELERALALRSSRGALGGTTPRVLACGKHWEVADVICTFGPQDRSFEEQHARVCIAIVVAGTFQYRTTHGEELMTPGSLLLGDAGECFECRHEHNAGDRCLSFRYDPEYFENLARDAGDRRHPKLRVSRVPPLRAFAPVVARGCAGLFRTDLCWEELGVEVAARTVQLVKDGNAKRTNPRAHALAKVSHAVRWIADCAEGEITLGRLAEDAELSPFHFLRTFVGLTGVTPHQYVLRTRLREAAMQIAAGREKILDVALDCGFGDVSNFNRAFHAEFGMSPRAYRRQTGK